MARHGIPATTYRLIVGQQHAAFDKVTPTALESRHWGGIAEPTRRTVDGSARQFARSAVWALIPIAGCSTSPSAPVVPLAAEARADVRANSSKAPTGSSQPAIEPGVLGATPVCARPDEEALRVAQAIVGDFSRIAVSDEETPLAPVDISRLDRWLDSSVGLWVRWDPALSVEAGHYSSFSEPISVIQAIFSYQAHHYLPHCLDARLLPLPAEACHQHLRDQICVVGAVDSLGRRAIAWPANRLQNPDQARLAQEADVLVSHYIYVSNLGVYFGRVDSKWRVIAIDIEGCTR